jgi:hypothetical protein
MTYFSDFSPYSYLETDEKKRILNIGWLDNMHTFNKGENDIAILRKILGFCEKAVNKTRGYHLCPFCDNPSFGFVVECENSRIVLGSAEIWIKGEKDIIYAAPDLIYHYMKDHNYLPPKEFLTAVEKDELVRGKRIF